LARGCDSQGHAHSADRELAILTAGREVEAVYEWAAHEPIGLDEGVSREAVEVLRASKLDGRLQEREALITTSSDNLRQHTLADELYREGRGDVRQLDSRDRGAGRLLRLIGYVPNVSGRSARGRTPAFSR